MASPQFHFYVVDSIFAFNCDGNLLANCMFTVQLCLYQSCISPPPMFVCFYTILKEKKILK